MAENKNHKRKGGGKTIWDIIADYAIVWWAAIMGTLIIVFIVDVLSW